MGARRIKALGEFAWQDADVGVECLRCGVVRVYCAFEAVVRFRERNWSPAVDEAIKRFLCGCGSRELRFRAVSITKRPKPIPIRPVALRPIYVEDGRALSRRGEAVPPDPQALETAVAVLQGVNSAGRASNPDLAAAIETLKPYVYDHAPFEELLISLGDGRNPLYQGSALGHAIVMILRQLGRFGE